MKPKSWSKYAADSSYNKSNKVSDKSKQSTTEGPDIKEDKNDKKKKHKKKIDQNENDEVKKALGKVYFCVLSNKFILCFICSLREDFYCLLYFS